MKIMQINNDNEINSNKLKGFGSLQEIFIYKSKLKNPACEFPASLLKFSFSSCEKPNLEMLPKTVKALVLYDCADFTGDKLLENLNEFEVYGCYKFTGDALLKSKSLHILKIFNCNKFDSSSLKALKSCKIYLGDKVFVDEKTKKELEKNGCTIERHWFS